MLLQPNKKNVKKLRDVLQDLYKHLDSSATVLDVSQSLVALIGKMSFSLGGLGEFVFERFALIQSKSSSFSAEFLTTGV